MKYFNLFFIVMFTLTLNNSCKGKIRESMTTATIDSISNIPLSRSVISMKEKEIRQYYEDWCDVGLDGITVMSADQQEKYTDLAIELLSEALTKAGYKQIPEQTAFKAIKKYFNIDITDDNYSLQKSGFYRYIFKEDVGEERKAQNKLMDPEAEDSDNFFGQRIFVPKYNYIVYYPTIEQAVQIQGFSIEDCDLNKIRTGILSYKLNKSIFYENLFIFYDSKAALAWLKTNNPNFLKSLLVDYGYDKSDEINKLMLDQIDIRTGFPPSGNGYTNVFASHKKDGKLSIHQGLLQYMANHADKRNLYFCMLNDYEFSLLEMQSIPDFEGFTKEERYKIGAYVGYYYGLMYDKCSGTPCNTGVFDHFVYRDKDFVDYIKRNNYFGLKDFDKIIQQALERGVETVGILEHQMSGE